MYEWHKASWGTGGWLVMGLVMLVTLVIWSVVVVGVVTLVRASSYRGTPPPREPVDSAKVILAERLARGEISPEEYTALVAVLSRDTQ